MRAISIFSLEAGTSTLGWRADIALRMRVSISAIGSDVVMLRTPVILPLPARLNHAGDFSGEGEVPETNPAQTKLAQKAARPAAAEAAVTGAGLELGGLGVPFLHKH